MHSSIVEYEQKYTSLRLFLSSVSLNSIGEDIKALEREQKID